MRDTAHRLGADVAAYTASSISELSHRNPGWIIAYQRGMGAKKAPQKINMLIAMQQVAGHDPWLNDEPNAAVHAALLEADQVDGEPW